MRPNFRINANGELVVYPLCITDEEDTTKVYYLEFLDNETINQNDTLKLSDTSDYYIYKLPEDGMYIYYKLCIYSKESKPSDYEGLYYDEESDELMFQNEVLNNIADVLPYLEMGYVRDWFKIEVFSILKLQNCLLSLQKSQLIDKYNKQCGSSQEYQFLNFLFISIYVLENLIQERRFGEAIDILNMISSCDGMCNKNTAKNSKCNCK